jgi:hypothetical protein
MAYALDRQEQKDQQRNPFGFMYGRFIRFWGMDAWHNTAWPTTDKIVPFKTFVQMYRLIVHVEAAEIETTSYATAMGYARAQTDGTNFKLNNALEKLRELANPQEAPDGDAE